jgi:hypothetical protein
MPLGLDTIELLLKQLSQQVDDLRARSEANSQFVHKLVGGLVVLGLVVGGMQFYVARQVALLDAVRANQRAVIERIIVLEVEAKFHRQPPPDDKEKP